MRKQKEPEERYTWLINGHEVTKAVWEINFLVCVHNIFYYDSKEGRAALRRSYARADKYGADMVQTLTYLFEVRHK